MSSVQDNVAAGVDYAVRHLGEDFAMKVTKPVQINSANLCVFAQVQGSCSYLLDFKSNAERNAYYPRQFDEAATNAEWDRVIAERQNAAI